MPSFDFSLLLRGQYHDMLVAGFALSLKLAAATLVFALPLALLVALLRLSPLPALRWIGATYVETVVLAALGLVLGLPVGVLLGVARVSPIRWVRLPVTALVLVVRGTPLLMVVFWAYFFLPSVTGHKTDQFSTMLIALVVFDGVYLAEIVRAGIQGVPSGQTASARSLGFGYWQILRFVVLPQALRTMLPSLVNQFVSTIKETSLGYIIGLTEVSFIASQINSQVFTKPAEVYVLLGGSYFVLCFGLSRAADALERRLSRAPKRA